MPSPSEETVRLHLEIVLASQLFQRSPRQSAFLRFVVEKVLAGESDQIKEYEIAVAAYDRPADHSPRVDPIVRVEAARLRAKLMEYYSGAGSASTVRIVLPKGTYVPELVDTTPIAGVGAPAAIEAISPGDVSRANPSAKFKKLWLSAAGMMVLLSTVAIVRYRTFSKGSPAYPTDSKIPISIAVLPSDARGIQHDLAVDLDHALMTQMRTMSWPYWHIRTAFKNGDPALPKQDAQAVFHATISLTGGVLKVQGELDHSESKIVLWNGSVVRKTDDPLFRGQQSDFLGDIAFELLSDTNNALMERMEGELSAAYPARSEARLKWLEGDSLRKRGDPDQTMRAIASMERARELDPNFAWNHASLSYAYVAAAEFGLPGAELFRRRAREEAAEAVRLGPFLALARAAQVHIAEALDWNFPAASAACVSALNLLSGSSSVPVECAEVYSLSGRQDLAEALVLPPVRRSPNRASNHRDFSTVLYRERKWAQSEAEAAEAVRVDPKFIEARYALAKVRTASDNQQGALDALEGVGGARADALRAAALALRGERNAAVAALAQAEGSLTSYQRTELIIPYFALGLPDKAKPIIAVARQNHSGGLLQVLVDPVAGRLDKWNLLEPIRSEFGLRF